MLQCAQMSPWHRNPWPHSTLAGALIAVFISQSFFASQQKSPAFDEPPHVASGLSYLETGVFFANPQHPPLLKEMSALFLEAAGIHWPRTGQAQALTRGDAENAEWAIGKEIIADNGPDRVMLWARLPFTLLAACLGLLIYVWGRELFGSAAGLGALFLYVLDPTILAHSFLVTTDVGLAAFSTLFLWTLWRYVRKPHWRRLAMSGLAMGAMLGAKFSGLFLAPVAGALLIAALRWPADKAMGSSAESTPVSRAHAAVPAGPGGPRPVASGKKGGQNRGAGGAAKAADAEGHPVEGSSFRREMAKRAGAFLVICLLAAVVVEALYFFPSDPFLYLTGLQKVNADHVAGYLHYLHGDLAERFGGYFLAALLLKEPLATILLAAAGLLVLLRSASAPVLHKLFLLLPPAFFVLAMTIFADDLGVRYIIPALPFAHLLGGLALARLLGSGRAWAKYAAVALCLWLAVEAAGIYPDHLSYFNEAACLIESPSRIGFDGGSRCGPLWLDDSNVDWGQGLKQLRAWMGGESGRRAVRLANPWAFPPDAYGLKADPVGPDELLAGPPPGLYAVSAHLVARLPALGEQTAAGRGSWLRRSPDDIVGHAFYIYRVR